MGRQITLFCRDTPNLKLGPGVTLTELKLGFALTIERVRAVVLVAGTGTNASRALRVRKTSLGYSTVASKTIALADTATPGTDLAVALSPANATFDDNDTLSVLWDPGGTAFTGGALNLVITYRQRLQEAA